MSNARFGLRIRNGLVRGITEGLASSDADALAFIAAAGITDITQQVAVNTLVLDLKAFNLWTKMKALYPFVGGTANSHKYNLKNPQDLNAAFRLAFNGGITHNQNGVTFNGVNAFADTFLIESANSLNNNLSFSVYSRTNIDSGVDIGHGISALGSNIFTRFVNNFTSRNQSNEPTGSVVANLNSEGFFGTSRQNNLNYRSFKNTTINNFIEASNTFNNLTFYIGARNNNGTAGTFSARNLAFSHIGEGLSNQEITDLYNIIQAYQTTLNRQV